MKKLLKKIFNTVENYSWMFYFIGLVSLLIVSTVLLKTNVVKKFEHPIFPIENYQIPQEFNFFERKSSSTTKNFIKSAFQELNGNYYELETASNVKVIHSIYRARKSKGKQCTVVLFKYDENDPMHMNIKGKKNKFISGAAIAFNLLLFFKKTQWTTSDVIFVALPRSDPKTEIEAASEWIQTYEQKPVQNFEKAGLIMCSIVLDIDSTYYSQRFTIISGTKLGTIPKLNTLTSIIEQLKEYDIDHSIYESQALSGVRRTFYEKRDKKTTSWLDYFLESFFDRYFSVLRSLTHVALSLDKHIGVSSAFSDYGMEAFTLKGVNNGKALFKIKKDTIEKQYFGLFRTIASTVRTFGDLYQKPKFVVPMVLLTPYNHIESKSLIVTICLIYGSAILMISFLIFFFNFYFIFNLIICALWKLLIFF